MKNTNKIKLIAIDLDHTLTNFYDFLSLKNKLAIWKAQNLGIKIIIVTGRDLKRTEKIAKKLKIHENINRVICLNGAITYQINQKKILNITFLPKKFMRFFVKKNNFNINKIFINDREEFFALKKTFLTLLLKIFLKKRMRFINCKELLKENIVSGFVFGFKKNIKKIETKCLRFKNIFFASGFPFTSQFSATNKGEAVKNLANKFKINANEIMAFGDSLNDLELFRYVKYGIAMKNAHHKIKNISYDKTTHWKDNGVAKGIKKYLF